MRGIAGIFAAFAVVCAIAAPASADQPPGVARVHFLAGTVRVIRADGERQLAARNTPIFAGDQVLTEADGRVEIGLTEHQWLRLDHTSAVEFDDLDAGHHIATLEHGNFGISLLHGWLGTAPVLRAPAITWQPIRAGYYRAVVRPDRTLELLVRHGMAQLLRPLRLEMAQPGATFLALGSPAAPVISTTTALPIDDFDRFNGERDREIADSLQSAQYAGYVVGADDLIAYGNWQSVAGYGNVWVPTVTDDWAPYQHGRWIWAPYYGWTWIADEVWGWAPYHYGRWLYQSGIGWCWVPPPPTRTVPEWSPALVGFISIGRGIGWVPLAPHEHANRWWGRQVTHYDPHGVTSLLAARSQNNFRNLRIRNAVTVFHRQQLFVRTFVRHNPARQPVIEQHHAPVQIMNFHPEERENMHEGARLIIVPVPRRTSWHSKRPEYRPRLRQPYR